MASSKGKRRSGFAFWGLRKEKPYGKRKAAVLAFASRIKRDPCGSWAPRIS